MFSKFFFTFAPIAIASSIAFAGPAGSQTGTTTSPAAIQSLTNLPCAQADGAMMSGMNDKSVASAPSGDLDKDFAAMMNMHAAMMMNMAKLEIRCGKNEKVRESARRFVQNAPRTHRFSGESE